MSDFSVLELTFEELQELVRKGDERVDFITPRCSQWQWEHSNCQGCPSALGCCKATTLLSLKAYRQNHMTEGPEENQFFEERVQKILEAKTEEVLDEIEEELQDLSYFFSSCAPFPQSCSWQDEIR